MHGLSILTMYTCLQNSVEYKTLESVFRTLLLEAPFRNLSVLFYILLHLTKRLEGESLPFVLNKICTEGGESLFAKQWMEYDAPPH